MNDDNLGSAAAQLIRTCPYANIATSFDDKPWNTPVFAVANDQLNFYEVTPKVAWLNCLSERNLTPATLKMRVEVSLDDIKEHLLKR